jgi:hypothetical protein
MNITYDQDRNAFVSEESGEYLILDVADRESAHFYYHVYKNDDGLLVGALIQRYTAVRQEEGGDAALIQYFVRKAWKAGATAVTDRVPLTENDLLMRKLETFVRASHVHAVRDAERCKFEMLFDPAGTKSLKELYPRG